MEDSFCDDGFFYVAGGVAEAFVELLWRWFADDGKEEGFDDLGDVGEVEEVAEDVEDGFVEEELAVLLGEEVDEAVFAQGVVGGFEEEEGDEGEGEDGQ